MSRTTARLRTGLLIAAFSVGALTLSGCTAISDLFPQQAARDAETQEISEAGEADVFSLAVGDCFNDQDADAVESVTAIPCADAHDYEAYFAFDVSEDGAFPGDEALAQIAEERCVTEFATFIGKSYEESTLDFNYLSPSEGSWDSGDREILCLAMAENKTTGSLAGTGI
ncbi:hypothetical protein C3B59_08595 [Cryobacterium zongtaii]|uniref:Septum formation-related domain-containing protein n=1 Tax=Cryobacterium zongtaii TaxID=1259217 RepID=A0A2S3ZGF8_9MICO|nr:septum formation family protein [Cryobacterium zongtaii]POH66466.1 hypothetical protein C3B59_08595 [Cryobacterium zongtaii]